MRFCARELLYARYRESHPRITHARRSLALCSSFFLFSFRFFYHSRASRARPRGWCDFCLARELVARKIILGEIFFIAKNTLFFFINEYQVWTIIKIKHKKNVRYWKKYYTWRYYYKRIFGITFSVNSHILIGRHRWIILASPLPPYFVSQADHGLLGWPTSGETSSSSNWKGRGKIFVVTRSLSFSPFDSEEPMSHTVIWNFNFVGWHRKYLILFLLLCAGQIFRSNREKSILFVMFPVCHFILQ